MQSTWLLARTWHSRWLRKPALWLASDESLIEFSQRAHFEWLRANQNPKTGLVLDRDRKGAPASVAATGFALTAYPVAFHRGWITREEAIGYLKKTLYALSAAPQGPERTGVSGHWGMFYHFVDPETGTRATAPEFWDSELSTIDTALLMSGVLAAKNFSSGESPEEKEIREQAQALYERVEWDRFVDERRLILHAWTPEMGMWNPVYCGYSEALLLYVLALGSPTHPVPAECWKSFIGDAQESEHYGTSFIGMPGMPLFCYQYPHCWIDFRGIADEVNRRFGYDYFENARRATLVQHAYAQDNPNLCRDYGALDWGLTASDGPSQGAITVGDRKIAHRSYSEHGGPDGFDDCTIAPTAALSSLPYAPRLVLRTLRHWLSDRPELFDPAKGFVDAFNDSFENNKGWIGRQRIGIDQGPIVLMTENHRSGLIWALMRKDENIKRGLIRAGFRGGWLDNEETDHDRLKKS